jgi:hypothetical protein
MVLLELHELRQVRDVAVHGVHAFDHHQDAAVLAAVHLQQLAALGVVIVRESNLQGRAG